MNELPLRLRDLVPFVLVSTVIYVFHIPGMSFVRIDAVALTVILFSLYRPGGISLMAVFVIGLLQDIVSLSPFGQHALGLCIISYIVQHLSYQVRMHSPVKQLPTIVLTLLLLKLVYSWVAALGFGVVPSMTAVWSVLLTACLWPLMWWAGQMISSHRRLPGISH